MKFKNLVLTLGVLMMLAFTSMAAAAPSQVNRSMTELLMQQKQKYLLYANWLVIMWTVIPVS